MKLATVALVLSLVGCKKSQVDAAQAADDPQGAASEKATPTQQLGAKLNAYIVCLNQFSQDVYHGRHTWLDEFDAKKGPQQKQSRDTLYGPLELPDVKECKDGIDKVKGAQPKLAELEAAGDAYVAALVTLQPMTVQMREYFEQGDYKDDKLARAIEMHPKLMAAWEAFSTADRAIGVEVDKLEDRLATEQLAELEKSEGKKLRWHHKRTIITGKKVVAFALEVTSPFEIKDPAAFQAAIGEYDKAVNEYVTWLAANKAELEKQPGFHYSSMETDLKTFLKDAKDMLRRGRDKVAFSTGEKMTINANNGESVEGHPARVIRSYNSLIQTSNRAF